MFGKRSGAGAPQTEAPRGSPLPPPMPRSAPASAPARAAEAAPAVEMTRSEDYYVTKSMIFGALIEAIDLSQLSRLDPESARDEIKDIVGEIIAIKNVMMSIAEQDDLLNDICNDVLGYGPLEPLLARDDIADIMVNGAKRTFIEVGGKIQLTNIRFRDNAQLMNICQRIVSQVGRRVDESLADLRRPPHGRRLPRQRHRAAARHRRTLPHHPKVQEGQADPRPTDPFRRHIAGRQRDPEDHRQGALQRADLGRYRFGQDDPAQLHDQLYRGRRARHHLRGRRRAAAAAGPCGSARNQTAQPRRLGRDHHARPRQELPAHAARTHHRRRSARPGGLRSPPGHEHGPRRFDGHAPRQLAARGAEPSRIHDHDGRLFAALQNHPRDDRVLRRRDHPGGAPARRIAPHHARHGGDGARRRRRHHAGPDALRDHRRGCRRAFGWTAPLHGVGRPRFWERARYYGEEQRLAAALDAAEIKNAV